MLTTHQQMILDIISRRREHGLLASSNVHESLIEKGIEVSLITVKRALRRLKELGMLEAFGAGRSAGYDITAYGRMVTDIDPKSHNAKEPDSRSSLSGYNFDAFGGFLQPLFPEKEILEMDNATATYRANVKGLSKILEYKELERFMIELSWKSSKIEGNTYTLLDTEKLLVEGIPAIGHSKMEAQMILNHKEAFKFVREHQGFIKELTVANIEHVHKILIRDLGVGHGLQALCDVVNKIESPYAKSLAALLGISYIQPFEDGNKRTSRLIADAILLAFDGAPLSYRSVNESEYREAMFVFYELNSIVPFKRIFIEQYLFAAKNYSVK